ncbi:hypothetical protein GCM10010425_05740 [Streptomyces spororaveus]|uniref:Uncharacterized protein n=1 Tax=Streptomyces spororaveus TaxID=284039 RepID=A0ABQ3TFE6_9ACTN|nr:hypothetical protein Sspor_46570 [Streptomyces spororaveus]
MKSGRLYPRLGMRPAAGVRGGGKARAGARVGQCVPQERHDAALQQGVPPGLAGPRDLVGYRLGLVRDHLGRAVADRRHQQPDHGAEQGGRGEPAEEPTRRQHGLGEGGFGLDHLQDVAHEQEDQHGGARQDRREDRDHGADARAAAALAVVLVSRRAGRGQGLVASFLADLHVVAVLGGGRGRQQGAGPLGHGAQLFGVQPFAEGGELGPLARGAQRLVDEPVEFRSVFGQQVRSAGHVHPPMLRRSRYARVDPGAGTNGGEPATDRAMVERPRHAVTGAFRKYPSP